MRFVAVIAVLVVARTAYADAELDRARALEAQLEYEQALAIVDKLLARGGAEPARYAELQLFAGKLAAGLDRAPAAEAYFARALAVKPDLALPEGTSPKIAMPFTRARTRAKPLAVTARVTQGLVTLEVTDAVGIVRGIAVHVRVGDKHADVADRSALRLVIGNDAKVVEVAALDVNGNRVWVGPAIDDAPAIVGPAVTRERRPVIARWPTWAIATGVLATGAALAAWRFDVAQDEWDARRATADFTELKAIEDRGRRWSTLANLGFGVAGAAAITTAIFAVRGSERVTIVPGPSAGLGVAARF